MSRKDKNGIEIKEGDTLRFPTKEFGIDTYDVEIYANGKLGLVDGEMYIDELIDDIEIINRA